VSWSTEVRAEGGVITWDVPVSPEGLLEEAFLDRLRAIGRARAVADPVGASVGRAGP
jgi:hypothetical protein